MIPNLFVLGAGRCGTTSLHAILGQHPDIHASSIKEPTFFCWPFQMVRDPIKYFSLFDSDKTFKLESSHSYFSNPPTAQVLKGVVPHARFIIILRNPQARARALYTIMRLFRWEKAPTFLEALYRENDRFYSAEFARNCPQYFWNFMYIRSSMYDEQIERYFSLFSREQFHFLTLAELAKDPVAAIEGICRFLALSCAAVSGMDLSPKNAIGVHDLEDAGCEVLLDAAFEGLTNRVGKLVGVSLDWSR